MKEKQFYYLYGGLLIFYLIISLITLIYNPLPWYDETYMASLSKSFLYKGELIKQVAYFTDEPKVDLRFGPMYFLFTSLSFKLFGIGIFQYRIIAFISGLAAMLATVKIYRLFEKSIMLSGLIGLLLIFDPFYFRSMREGRMDLMALSFILFSIYFLLKIKPSFKIYYNNKYVLISGLMAALAVLTTPRSGFLYFGIGCLWLVSLLKDYQFTLKSILIWLIPILILYCLWINYAFGDLNSFLNFYQELSKKYTQAGNFYITIQKNQYILIPISLLTLLFGVIKYSVKFFTPVILCSIVSIISFYFLVQDPGPYSVFILPFYYLIIFIYASEEKRYLKKRKMD